jgi:hypothetical protein
MRIVIPSGVIDASERACRVGCAASADDVRPEARVVVLAPFPPRMNFSAEDVRFADEREVFPPEFSKLEDEAFDVFFAFHAIAVSSSRECGLRPHFCILRA